MMHLYEIDSGRGIYWEVYDHEYDYLASLPQNAFDQLLDHYRANGVDFVLHTLEEYDEYHLAVPSV